MLPDVNLPRMLIKPAMTRLVITKCISDGHICSVAITAIQSIISVQYNYCCRVSVFILPFFVSYFYFRIWNYCTVLMYFFVVFFVFFAFILFFGFLRPCQTVHLLGRTTGRNPRSHRDCGQRGVDAGKTAEVCQSRKQSLAMRKQILILVKVWFTGV